MTRTWAPGRVNLIGDHTDYTGGLALPMAIGLGITIHGHRQPDRVHLASEDARGAADLPLHIDDPAAIQPAWARYVAGVVAELRPTTGLTGTIETTLPPGRGLASSAALEVGVAAALGADLGRPVELAQACQRAEHRAVGVPCGIMDQLTVAAAVEGAALRLDCRSLEVRPVTLPDGLEVAVVDSGQRRALAGSPYAERRAQCAAAEARIGPLRDATTASVEALDDPVLRRRARHVTSENVRVDGFVAALAAGDAQLAGELMGASHASLRDDFEVSTAELDGLVAHLGSRPGVHGARLTGGGFGGCVVALCDPGVALGVDPVWRGRPAAGVSHNVEGG
jgi:galactokinase